MKYALALLLLYPVCSQAQYTLALNLEKGNIYHLNLNATIHFDGEVNGQKMAMNSTLSSMASFKVLQATADGYELEGSYDSMHINMKSPMGQMDYSTGPSNGDPTTGAMNFLVHKRFNLTLGKNGSVKKFTNLDTSGFQSMMRNFPMADGIKRMMLMGHFKQAFDRETMKANFEKLTAIYPDKKVALNDTWGNTIRPDSGTDNSIQITYQLMSYSNGVATIKGTSTTKASGKQKMGMASSYDMNGHSNSSFTVDAQTGWIKEAEIRNDLTGSVQVSKDNAKEVKTIPIQVVTTARVSSN